ncbi:MAG: hypothetical protein IE927_16500 [Rhodobacterales bacterium]|nr:hypothetical protein [Rhodobacterales bacterium]
MIHAAVVPAGHAGATATLALRPSFRASSLIPPAPGKAWDPVEVPAIPLPDLLAQVAPTVMTVDLEGARPRCSTRRCRRGCGWWWWNCTQRSMAGQASAASLPG